MLTRENLHWYQRKDIELGLENEMLALLLEMGLGKTVTALTIFNDLKYREAAVSNCLILAPKRVVQSVWKQETSKWEHLKHLEIVRVIGTESQRMAALKTEADIHVVSRDNLVWLVAKMGGLTMPWDMLIVDESSSFKNPSSKRFKALKSVFRSFDRRLILTGTFAPNGLIDIWSQIYLLDGGERLGTHISHYRAEYFKPDKTNGRQVYSYALRTGKEEKIYNAIGDIVSSRSVSDTLEMPELVTNIVDTPFSDTLQGKYVDFERDKVMEFLEESEIITPQNAAALMNKLLQFSNGFIYGEPTEEGRPAYHVHDLKLQALDEIIEGANGEPVLVAWAYREDMHRIMSRFKKLKPVNSLSETDINNWNRGKTRLHLMHPASGGHGLNLQAGGRRLTWFGLTWSLELYQQMNARLFRQGQKDSVIINHIVNTGTIDRRVYDALVSKAGVQNGLMQAVKATIDKYA